MSHLSAERLAALFDEQPTAAELAHLAGCAACSHERGAYEALADMAKNGPAIGQPLTSWQQLAPRLKQDGVIDTGKAFGRRPMMARRWMQAAAAVALVAGGAAFGRMTARATRPNAATGVAVDSVPAFRDVSDAQAAAARSKNVYEASMAFLASHDANGIAVSSPAAIKTRLAAIDRVSQIMGAALEDAPYDSVINSMYLNTQTQRDASIRQLNSVAMRAASY